MKFHADGFELISFCTSSELEMCLLLMFQSMYDGSRSGLLLTVFLFFKLLEFQSRSELLA